MGYSHPKEKLKLGKRIDEKQKAEIVKAEIVLRDLSAFLNFSFQPKANSRNGES